LPHLIDRGDVLTRACPATSFITFNVTAFPFNNRHIRKAFSLAMNRKEIVQEVTLLSEEVAHHPLPPVLRRGHLTHLIEDFNAEEAKKELAIGLEEMGLETLPPISLIHRPADLESRIVQTIQNQLRKTLGVHLQLEKLDQKAFFGRLYGREYQMGKIFWYAQYDDPMNILERFGGVDNQKNYSGFDSQKYTDYVHLAATSVDGYERDRAIGSAVDVIGEELPFTTLYHWKIPYMKKPYVKNLMILSSQGLRFYKISIDLEEKNAYLNRKKEGGKELKVERVS